MKRPQNLNPNDYTTNYINLTEGDSLTESLLQSQKQFNVLFDNKVILNIMLINGQLNKYYNTLLM